MTRWLLFRSEDGGTPVDAGGAPAAEAPAVEGGSQPSGERAPSSTPPSPPSGGDGAPTPPSTPPAGWQGPSQEEWNTVVAALHDAYQRLTPQEKEEVDFDEMSPQELVQFAVDQRLQGIAPILEHAQRQAGEARLNALFDQEEKTIGKFDRKLAERIANAVFYEVGDPLQAAKMGAAEAKRLREEYGKESVEEYKKSLQRQNFEDPEVGGGGQRIAPDAKTYDEVISKWSGEEEV